MNGKLIKPYEISVWEDNLLQSNDGYRLVENKLATIGSDTMTGLNKIYDPVFNKKSNGEKTLTFSLKYKYFDPYTENEEVINPFASFLVNERKVKLHYDGQWYEFIIKDHSESSEDFTWTYTCTDAFVYELSKIGYNIEFDNELNNNQGTAKELAQKTLVDTDWKVGEGDLLKQFIEEPIYRATLVSTEGISIINANDGSRATLGENIEIYLFYNYVANKNGKFVQFILRNGQDYTIDSKNVITSTNYRIETELVCRGNGFYISQDSNTPVITWNDVETYYQANRLVYNQKTTYDPVTKRTVDRFVFGDGREVYKYSDSVYTTSNVVINLIANSDNFNILEDGTLRGWNPYVDSSDNDKIKKLELVSYPELGKGKQLADIERLTQTEGYLKAQFVGAITEDYLNTIYNSGFQNNVSFINSVSAGDEYVFRWRAGYGEQDSDKPLESLIPNNKLGLLVAKCTRDTPGWGRYYYHIDTDDIILDFRPSEENVPQELNNIIEGGEIREIEGRRRYVIDDVVQTVSTGYLYRDNTDGSLNYWDKVKENFIPIDDPDASFIPYYYLTAKARRSVPNSELTDSTQSFGVFIYTTDNSVGPVYIQDIQLTKCIRDAAGAPVVQGNVPTATSDPVDYYYLKPESGAVDEDIRRYSSLDELKDAYGITEDILPFYNENSEKTLTISASKTNCFDILQTIAETFECWVDLVVNHDDEGYITYTDGAPDKWVYLREYVGKDNYAGFKYGININSIERTINSDEIVTKLIVDQSQSEYVDEGYVSIASAPSNQSGESYILNFEYYYNQGLLDREQVEKDRIEFTEKIKQLNLELAEKEKERRDLEDALTKLNSKRNIYTELIDSAIDQQQQALSDFKYYTNQDYEDYRKTYNEKPDSEEDEKSLFDEENIYKVLGTLYTSSATLNNYSGILTNTDKEYWKVWKRLHGSENYVVKIWPAKDDLGQTHIYIELDDYLVGLQIFTGGDGVISHESTVSKKYFDLTLSTNYSTVGTLIVDHSPIAFDNEAGIITLKTPGDFYFKLSGTDIGNTYEYRIGDTISLKIVNDDSTIGIEDEIDELLEEKKQLVNAFHNRYNRFISEGTWNSTDYIDSELYYLDALQVSNTSAQPSVSYTINVVEVSQLEGLELYSFDAGDKTYIEDTEFFGWANINVGTDEEPKFVLTPAREEVIISEVEWHLDAPEENVITVQNYKTRFEDLFQRISATVQTVQYNEATYAKTSTLLDADGTINENVLVDSLQRIAGKRYNLTTDGSVLIDGDKILVQNLTETNKRVIINSEGIRVSSDGGSTWSTAIDGHGINVGAVYTGKLNTDQVTIGNDNNPSFRWDKSGISAYKSDAEVFVKTTDTAIDPEKTYYTRDLETGEYSEVANPRAEDIANYYEKQTGYDLQTFVRYDQYGLYGIKDNGTFLAQSLEDVKDKAHFAVTWDGFFIKNSYPGGGRVEITSDNDFRVMNIPEGKTEEQEKIKIGALEWGKDEQDNPIISPDAPGATDAPTLYGIRIKNNDGDTVMETGDDGDLTITGTINANAGNIGGMSVNNDWLRMNYIVLEPGEGIYSTYPNVKGEIPVDPSISVYPFWISDTDGSAIFNNVTVRGSIKTSVFEYEEIQAVGGAFMFRPSSAVRDVEIDDNDLIFTTEKPGLFKVGSWLKISNFSSADEQDTVTPDVLNGFGLTYIYPVASINGRQVRLTGAAEIINNNVTTREELAGGSLIDMGNQAGTSNYGIGINSSDGFINLPPRAISLFETTIHPNLDPKVSYNYRGILGTLPDERLNNLSVDSTIYEQMRGTQGIYTDNMYIGDINQFIAFYEDANGDKQLKIKANQVVYEVVDDQGNPQWHDVANIETEGVPGPQGPAGEDAITVKIDSSAGEVFLNKQITTTLTCTVIKGNGTDITNQVTRFNWIKKNADGTVDTSWSRPLAGNTISISEADVTSKAIFICEVEF